MDIRDKDNHPFIDHIQRWGNTVSLTLLDPNCHIFTIPSAEGIIGYRATSSYAIVFGDPVCSPSELENLTFAFHEDCRKKGKNIVYVGASEKFTHWALPNTCKSAIQWGSEIILNPMQDPLKNTGKKAIILRNQYSQAARNNMSVHEYTEHNSQTEQAIEAVAHKWRSSRKGPQVYFYEIEVFSNRLNKRWFYTQQNNRITGVVILNRLDNQNGWALNMLMVDPESHKYTSEYLITGILELLRQEKSEFFSIGSHPASELGRIEGLGKFSTWLARNTYKTAQKIFKLNDRQRYWQKFYPHYQPSYLLFSAPYVDLKAIFAIVRSLNAI